MSVNKVILVGNLGKDPELRYSGNQNAICSFSLATSDRRKDPASGEWKEYTEWHNIVAWGKTGENCHKYLKKGRQCYIEGKIRTRKWQDKEGKDRWTTEINADIVQFIGSKEGGRGMSDSIESNSYSSGGGSTGSSVIESIPTADQLASSTDAVTFDDDDIPF